MAIITISRGAFSGGKKLAVCLSERLGYRAVSRDVLVRAASEYGISEDKLLEAIEQKPTIKERIGMELDRFHYLSFVQAALCEEAKNNNIIYHGNGGHILLKDISHVIKVKLIPDIEQRIASAMEGLKFTRAEAIAYLYHMDDLRSKWTKLLYSENWDDPAQYDVAINLKNMTMQHACELIGAMTKFPEFQATDESTRAMNNLLQASKEKQQLHKVMLQK